MSPEAKGPPSEDVRPRVGIALRLYRFVVTLLLLFVILYVTALMLSRTEGFRAILAGQIRTRTGLDVTIGSSHATPALDIVCRDVSWRASYEMPVGVNFRIEKAILRWTLRPASLSAARYRLELHQPLLALAQREGAWAPPELAVHAGRLAGMLGITRPDLAVGVGETIEPEGPPVALMIRGGSIMWTEDSALQASIDSLKVDVTPLALPGRSALHVSVHARVQPAPESAISDRSYEVFVSDGRMWPLIEPSRVQ